MATSFTWMTSSPDQQNIHAAGKHIHVENYWDNTDTHTHTHRYTIFIIWIIMIVMMMMMRNDICQLGVNSPFDIAISLPFPTIIFALINVSKHLY